MTATLRLLGFLLLVLMVGCLVPLWRHRPDAQDDVARDRRVDRALRRGDVVADEDRPAVPVVLTRTAALAAASGSAFLSQVCLQLADHGTNLDGLEQVALGLTGVAWVLALGLTVRVVTVGRRQGLRPARPW